eukprot:COSAG02_NODE_4073_length_5830_cov_3.915373_3_plen_47_part_00
MQAIIVPSYLSLSPLSFPTRVGELSRIAAAFTVFNGKHPLFSQQHV